MTFILILLLSFSALAYQVSFVGPCDSQPIVEVEVKTKLATVGDLTVHFLDTKRIPFIGNAGALQSVFDTPMGDEAIEVRSDNEMRAYGWCYFVNDLEPDVFANEYPLDESVQKIEWIFGFAHYKNGEWISSCTPAFTVKPDFLCKK